ncbi:MAG: hypothetical protein ACLRFP_04370 [Alphaproteobacteria bacterium]
MSEKTRAELKEQINIMNHNYQVIKEMREKGYQYSIGEVKRLQDELERTRKALDVAVDAIDKILVLDSGKFIQEPAEMWKIAKSAKDKITALEQKDVK